MNKRNDAIAAFTGLGGVILILFGVHGLLFTPGFGTVGPLFDLGVLAVSLPSLGAGVALLFYSFRRAKRHHRQQATS